MNENRRFLYGISLVLLYVMLVTLPLVVSTFTLPRRPHSFASELAQSLALITIGLYELQLVLAVRIKMLDRIFGLDRLFAFHRMMGIFLLLIILLHPLLLGYSKGILLFPFLPENPWFLRLGLVTLVALLTHVLISVFRKRINLSWERWRVLHDIFGVGILVLALTHSWFASSDLENPVMRALWITLPLAGITLFIWHRWVRYGKRTSGHFEVMEIIEEARDTFTVKLKPGKGEKIFDYLPGQFHFIRFFSSGISDEEHHFTISSSPTQNFLSSTIKGLGDFTRTIKGLKPGDKAIVNGPFGHFTYLYNENKMNLVFIAGGVGITPLMSMIRYMRDQSYSGKVILFYANVNEENVVFKKELDEILSASGFLKVVHVMSKPGEKWQGEKGFVDIDKIKKYTGEDFPEADYYVCGPGPMLTAVIDALKKENISSAKIHSEIFELAEGFIPSTRRYHILYAALGFLIAIFISAALIFAGIRSNA